jgi:hypothetical protein
MDHAYQLDIRVVVSQRGNHFIAQPLDIAGIAAAPDRETALNILVAGIRGVLEVGEPIYRSAPRELLKLWTSENEADMQRLVPKISAYRSATACATAST